MQGTPSTPLPWLLTAFDGKKQALRDAHSLNFTLASDYLSKAFLTEH